MTTDRSIIPSSYPVLAGYLITTDERQLATNAATTNSYFEDYGWDPAQSTGWTGHKTAILALYGAFVNPLTTNHTVKQNLDTAIATFRDFVKTNTLIEKIRGCSIVGNDDANVFHFDLVTADHTHLNSKISTKPTVTIEPTGPGSFDVRCRTASDATRPSIDHEHGATEVEIAYAIFDHAPSETEEQDPDDDSVFSKGHSTKAHFPFHVSNINRRKFLVSYFRWNNPSYPQFAGDWCPMQTNIII